MQALLHIQLQDLLMMLVKLDFISTLQQELLMLE
jgi:hypothetical protein